MLAFEVVVNGRRLCVVGTGTSDVVSAVVSWARRCPEVINFHVGGIVSGDTHDHMGWKTPHVSVGDEITIRVIETDICDAPDETYHPGLCHGESEPEGTR